MNTPDTPDPALAQPLSDDDFERLESILDDLAERSDGIPSSWEYCDGFLTALLCGRRLLAPSEYFPVLFGGEPGDAAGFGKASFRDEAQLRNFLSLWMRRWNEIAAALQAPVETLDDERTLQPYLTDVRTVLAELPPEEQERFQASFGDEPLPAFAQYWAVGFWDVVQAWPDDWRTPRDRELGREWEDALMAIAALLEADEDEPSVNPVRDDGPPTVSADRIERFGDAIWAVYDLHDIARSLGPPIETVRKAAEPGRNDPCPCGSGKKYKRCCGAG
ncbi:hypothetical protein A9O67_02330 [Tepidimonas fonticaldi]|uniref:Zinc chelation protein SecC n=1 Tax=Tepidimonas fonticaldi TaxID=1101373 RepID=A0A1A6DVV4_9BURK|nr:YecA family protein [Tepidimonas fonticaldi]OBS31057.1 hypothetical protein A9O67_02330 [Tepidimonas fonticaldi]